MLKKNSTRRIKFTHFTQEQVPRLNKETLMKVFSIVAFELITAKKYANKNNIKIIYTDREKHKEEYFKKFPNNLNRQIIPYFKMLKEKTFELDPEYFQKLINQLYDSKNLILKK